MSLIEKVISNGNCIGCGACAFAYPDHAGMQLTQEGHWQALLKTNDISPPLDRAGKVLCPMSGETLNETEIAADLYPDAAVDHRIGRYLRNVVGHVEVGDYRAKGGSGGLVTWLLAKLLESDEIDAVIHVIPNGSEGDEPLFSYSVSNSVKEVIRGSKSRYYPVEMSEVFALLANDNKRFAVVGLPCFLKALRLLENAGNIPLGRVRHTIGLVCGHLKSRFFGDYLAWQKNIMPGQLADIDFRYKLPDRSASNYGFAVRRKGTAASEVYPMRSAKGRDWGEGLFKNPACEFCDDVLAECADIAVGDAWLPNYVEDWQGTNVAVIRSAALNAIIAKAEEDGLLSLENASVEQIAESQAAGLRHRRQGLMHRLARRKNAGQWMPKKRVAPALERSPSRRRIYDVRLRIAQESSKMFAEARMAGDLYIFEQKISPLLQEYHKHIKGSSVRKIGKMLKSKMTLLYNKFRHFDRVGIKK